MNQVTHRFVFQFARPNSCLQFCPLDVDDVVNLSYQTELNEMC